MTRIFGWIYNYGMLIYSGWKLARLAFAFLLLTVLPVTSQSPSRWIDWPQFGLDSQHSGNNSQETILSAANVSQLKVMFKIPLPGIADGAPVYLTSITTPLGVKNLLFLTMTSGTVLALDANTGAQVWIHPNQVAGCHINNGLSPCYTTSSPVVDPNRQFVYSYELDGLVHKFQVGYGTEIKTGGWPERATLKPFDEKGSSALSFATAKNGDSFLYVANSGYPGDNGDYQGHLTAINLADGTQKVFNTMCSDQAVHFQETPGIPDCSGVQSAIWGRPGVVYNPENDRIYMATGNGTFDPTAHEWGDTDFALNPDGSGSSGNPLDSYTPANYATLQSGDADLGSTSPAILPVPAASKVAHLAVQGGKDGKLRLINLDDLSGAGGSGHIGGEIGSLISAPGGGEVLAMPAVWVNPADNQTWVFAASSNGIAGIKLVLDGSGNPSLSQAWEHSGGGSSPVVANGILYFAQNNLIQALNPVTGSVLWSYASIGGIHWESPIVVNGVLYITDQASDLTAFSINGKVPRYPYSTFFPRIHQ